LCLMYIKTLLSFHKQTSIYLSSFFGFHVHWDLWDLIYYFEFFICDPHFWFVHHVHYYACLWIYFVQKIKLVHFFFICEEKQSCLRSRFQSLIKFSYICFNSQLHSRSTLTWNFTWKSKVLLPIYFHCS
jgi:hypothetical protein